MKNGKTLYKVVRERLLRRIRNGEWAPGEVIPNEFEIAKAYDVSQGTARKAIAELASDGILTRHQGRGTFVTDYTVEQGIPGFPHFIDAGGAKIDLQSGSCTVARGPATAEERKALDLAPGSSVLRLQRLRLLGGRPVVAETITLPAAMFRALRASDVTDGLYDLYQRSFGVHVVRITDRLSAVGADRKRAKDLRVSAGTPLLRIERIARALGDQKVEWRICHCHADGFTYLNAPAPRRPPA